MLNEIHLRRRSTPDEMVDSYYADVIEIAKERRFKFNKKQKPLFENEFYFDDKDLVIFCMYQNENSIFRKPVQICVGEYFKKDLDEFVRVKDVLYHYIKESHVSVHDSQRTLKINEVIPLVKLGMIVKAVLNQNRLNLIWGEQLDRKIRRWFYGTEKVKNLQNKSNSELTATKSDKTDNEKAGLDVLDDAYDEKYQAISHLSRQAFNHWFQNRFIDTALLKQTNLMEIYASVISRTIAK